MAIHERPMIAIRPTRIITWDQSSKNLAGHSNDLRGDRRTF
jgi:hypothetical protein